MESENEPQPIEIFAGTSWQAGMVKSLLENAEIMTLLRNDSFAAFNSLSIGENAVKVIVSSEDYVKAKEVVDEYLRNENKPEI